MTNNLNSIIAHVAEIKAAERTGDLTARNALTRALFKSPARRKVIVRGHTVETWFDQISRNWITEVDYGDAEYSGNQGDAAISHFWALDRIINS